MAPAQEQWAGTWNYDGTPLVATVSSIAHPGDPLLLEPPVMQPDPDPEPVPDEPDEPDVPTPEPDPEPTPQPAPKENNGKGAGSDNGNNKKTGEVSLTSVEKNLGAGKGDQMKAGNGNADADTFVFKNSSAGEQDEPDRGFVNAPVFQGRFGELDDAGFVTLLYQNVLGRDPDAQGLARWTGDLAGGAERAAVVQGFSGSRELRNDTATDAAAFAREASPSTWADDVFRLYQATLDRAPNAQGLARWTGDLAADASRAEVVRGFAQNREFVSNTAPNHAAWVLDQGTDDVLAGGAGNDMLAGGRLSDTFVFAPNSGADRVLDLEPWDC